jgi:hypothetical protein
MSMTLIQHIELGSSAASITFSSIPATFTDLYLVYSLRGTNSSNYQILRFNNLTTSFTQRELIGDGSSASSSSRTDSLIRATTNPDTATANTNANAAIYIPNYAGSTNKSFSVDGVTETNGTTAFQTIKAGLWSNTAAISQITLGADANFASGSSATLYGITAGSSGGVVVS